MLLVFRKVSNLFSSWPTLLIGLGALASFVWVLFLAWASIDALSAVAGVIVDHVVLAADDDSTEVSSPAGLTAGSEINRAGHSRRP